MKLHRMDLDEKPRSRRVWMHMMNELVWAKQNTATGTIDKLVLYGMADEADPDMSQKTMRTILANARRAGWCGNEQGMLGWYATDAGVFIFEEGMLVKYPDDVALLIRALPGGSAFRAPRETIRGNEEAIDETPRPRGDEV